MRNFVTVLSAGLLLVAFNAAAEDKVDKAADDTNDTLDKAKSDTQEAAEKAGVQGSTPSGAAKYGPAGCGLGSLIFKPDSGFTQIFAATTNGTSATQTFGISSGTSNCDTGAGNSKSAKAFVETNRAALAKDIARGRGETISSLTALAGCSDPRAVGVKLQHSFRTIFSSAKATDAQVSDSVVNVLSNDASLSCSNLG
jgi:Protein of unknown function (DUF3015)